MPESLVIPEELQQHYHYVCERIAHIELVRGETGAIDELHSRELTDLRNEKIYIERISRAEAENATLRAQLAEAREAAGEIKELAIEQEPVSIGNQWAWRKVEFLTRSIIVPPPTEKEQGNG